VRRREFITLVGGAAVAWPAGVMGQQPNIPLIGFINGSSATAYAAAVQAFIGGLAETGHRVGENVTIEYRWAEGQSGVGLPSSPPTRRQRGQRSVR